MSRDPIHENGGMNLYQFVRNNPVQFIDRLGLEWIVEQKGKERANVWANSDTDTFKGLARKLGLDVSDYTKWLQTRDTKPELCKIYTAPNTVYVDKGILKTIDAFLGELSQVGLMTSWINVEIDSWKKRGFKVIETDAVTNVEIVDHIANKNTYGYVFVGHGASGATINSYDHLVGSDSDSPRNAVGADRYSNHGLSFMYLMACSSAEYNEVPNQNYEYNIWESNVATSGRFFGYECSIMIYNEFLHRRWTSGKNNDPYRFK